MCIGAISVVLSFALTQPDTPSLVTHVNGRVQPGDLVVSSPAAYLLMVQYGDAAARRETHIVSRTSRGTGEPRCFPAPRCGAPIPPALARGTATIYYVDVPGQPRAIRPPAPYEPSGPRRCYSTICLTVYRAQPVHATVIPPSGR